MTLCHRTPIATHLAQIDQIRSSRGERFSTYDDSLRRKAAGRSFSPPGRVRLPFNDRSRRQRPEHARSLLAAKREVASDQLGPQRVLAFARPAQFPKET